MKTKLAYWLAPLMWLALFTGAQAQLVGQSSPTQMTYALGSFKRIVLAGAADVRLVQGEVNQLVIEGDAEVQKRVEVDLNGGSLRIEPAGGWKFWNSRRTLVLMQFGPNRAVVNVVVAVGRHRTKIRKGIRDE